MLRPQASKMASQREPQGNEQTSFQVNIACLVVFPEGQCSNGSEQGREGCPLRFMLAHVEEIDQAGDDHNPAANANNPGKHTHHQAK